jgi:hypothetical protein
MYFISFQAGISPLLFVPFQKAFVQLYTPSPRSRRPALNGQPDSDTTEHESGPSSTMDRPLQDVTPIDGNTTPLTKSQKMRTTTEKAEILTILCSVPNGSSFSFSGHSPAMPPVSHSL